MPKLLSVNVSMPKNVEHKGKIVSTGIFKEPIEGRVKVRTLNINGDGQADLIGHGGEMRAVYVYSRDNYDYWEKVLGRNDLPMGQFGENFTIEGFSDQEVHVGDRFKIGSALFEVTQPRVPCFKLAIKMQHEGFYGQILKSGRLGFYFRVLEEGEVAAGDEIIRVKVHSIGMTIDQVNRLMYFDKDNYQGFKTALKIKALSPGWRYTFEDRLSKEKTTKKAMESYRSLTIVKKVPESDTITSFYLKSEDRKSLEPFLPGQFLPIKLDIPGQYLPVVRTYTLSDSPDRDYYRLSIKKEPAPPDQPSAYPGVSSNYFHDHVDVGTKITGLAPRGKFVLNTQKESPVVLLSAGVGLTPMISMLNSLIESKSSRKIWFIHGARNGNEHAMAEHVRKQGSKNPQLKIHIQYSRPTEEDQEGIDYYAKGYVDITLIKKLVPGIECDFYLCGPAPFMKSIFIGLETWGVDSSNISYEFFGPASVLQDRSKIASGKILAQTNECCDETTVNFSKSGVEVNWNPSLESLLDLAEVHGLNPNYSCRSGICQTCISDLLKGIVEYVNEPLDPPPEGKILMCCSKPKSDLIIDI